MVCSHRAELIITRAIAGTASNVVKERFELKCQLPAGHDGVHHDLDRDERWEDHGRELTHVLRHEQAED